MGGFSGPRTTLQFPIRAGRGSRTCCRAVQRRTGPRTASGRGRCGDARGPADAVSDQAAADAARPLCSAGGVAPPVEQLLEQVQIDHTVVDVMVFDERYRLPIGRPYRRDRRVQPLRGGAGGDAGATLGAVGGVVPGAHGHRQTGLARAIRRARHVADEWQARGVVPGQRRGVQERGAAGSR